MKQLLPSTRSPHTEQPYLSIYFSYLNFLDLFSTNSNSNSNLLSSILNSVFQNRNFDSGKFVSTLDSERR